MKFKNDRVNRLIQRVSAFAEEPPFNGKVYFVGDCVRNALLGGETPSKIEVVVDMEDGGCSFAHLIALRSDCLEVKTNPIMDEKNGIAYVRILTDDKCNDLYVTCCDMIKCVSPNPKDRKGTMRTDYKYRDLSVNALYYNIKTHKLYDPSQNGYNDLKKKTLRGIGMPESVFGYYPMRMLRTIRLASELGFGIERDTWLAMIKNASKMFGGEKNSTLVEFMSILKLKKPSLAFRRMRDCGGLEYFLPDIVDESEIAFGDTSLFEFTMRCMDLMSPNEESRLAALFHGVGEILGENVYTDRSKRNLAAELAEGEITRMGFTMKMASTVGTAIRHYGDFDAFEDESTISDKKIRRFMSSTKDALPLTIELMNAVNLCSKRKKVKQALDIAERCEKLTADTVESDKNPLPIDGNDIMREFHIKKGPIIGKCIVEVRKRFNLNPSLSKDECYDIVEEVLSKSY